MIPTFNPFDFATPAAPRRTKGQRKTEQHKQPRRGAAQKPPGVKHGGHLDRLASMLNALHREMAGKVAMS